MALRTRWQAVFVLCTAGALFGWFLRSQFRSSSAQSVVSVEKALPPLPDSLANPAPLIRTRPNMLGSGAFTELTGASGVSLQYYNDERLDRLFGAETNGGGLGWLDVDGNGLPDLVVVNGCRLPYDKAALEFLDGLFLNRGGGEFFDAAALAGIQENQFGQGVAVGDFDNDGWDDLYVCNFGTNVLYHNCGDGTFRPVAGDGAPDPTGWNAGAAFGDVDRDGDLDLYVTVYATADLDNVPVCYDSAHGTHRVYCGPDRYPATSHFLFLNQGADGFVDATSASGCDKTNGKGMGAVIVDLDHDAWPEIFVANDMSPSFLYHNLKQQAGEAPLFEEIGIASGVAFDGHGQLAAGMGIACGDADGDGMLDLYVSHYHHEGNTLYLNRGHLTFTDHTAPMRLFIPSLPYLGFGCEFVDYDNDGWLDLVVVNGHVLGPNYPDRAMNPQLYRNLAGKSFEEVTGTAGSYFQGTYLARGSASCDFDNDGAVDVAVSHLDRPVAVLRNVCSSRGASVGFKCIGTQSNRDGVNTELRVYLGDNSLTRQIVGGGSYQSAPDYRVLVGAGPHRQIDRLEVNWPSGRHEVWENLAVGALYVLIEGTPPRLSATWETASDDQ